MFQRRENDDDDARFHEAEQNIKGSSGWVTSDDDNMSDSSDIGKSKSCTILWETGHMTDHMMGHLTDHMTDGMATHVSDQKKGHMMFIYFW